MNRKPIRTVLIVNRGEIALRIIRTCREMGIRSVLGCSEVDLNTPAARWADEVYPLSGNASQDTYLNIEKILNIAKISGADAVHPGYGFLSERPEFVDACTEAGLIFIGPSSNAMRKLGNKVFAKQLASVAKVPLVPGFFESGATDEKLIQETEKIGFPLLAKASAGGGGRGMRLIESPLEMPNALRQAREEAKRSFGDDEMMIEKFIPRPRHIEVQIIADHHNQCAVLFERECSLQRRRQKVIEEAGSPLPDYGTKIWTAMREATLRLVKEGGYVGAGTAEFLVDELTSEFYFLEVNARLQVEHPITEAITGLDLVALQIQIAEGKPLNLAPGLMDGNRDLIQGHAIEARIIAEDPMKNFLPSVGPLLQFVVPEGPRIRVDFGFETGDLISEHYDSLLAKLIVHGPDRQSAIKKLKASLLDFHILGVQTNIPYLLEVIEDPEFIAGEFDVNWLERKFENWTPKVSVDFAIEFPGLGSLIEGKSQIGNSRATPSVAQNDGHQYSWEHLQGFRLYSSRDSES